MYLISLCHLPIFKNNYFFCFLPLEKNKKSLPNILSNLCHPSGLVWFWVLVWFCLCVCLCVLILGFKITPTNRFLLSLCFIQSWMNNICSCFFQSLELAFLVTFFCLSSHSECLPDTCTHSFHFLLILLENHDLLYLSRYLYVYIS